MITLGSFSSPTILPYDIAFRVEVWMCKCSLVCNQISTLKRVS